MLKIFLVEDEIIMREGIKNRIDWAKEQFEYIGDAGDGELAYPLILQKKPDILITDIRMPFMDGLELSRLVKAELPNIKIIVLSGYDEFEYAKEAIDIGITEYMLKPVTSAKLLESLHKVANDIIEQRKKEQCCSRLDEETAKKQIAQQMFFMKLVSADMPVSLLLKEGRELGIELAATNYNLLLLQLFNNESIEAYHEKLFNLKNALWQMQNQYRSIITIERSREEFWFIFKGQEGQAIETLIATFIPALKTLISDSYHMEYFGVIGKTTERLGDIKNCYTEANAEFAHRYIKHRNQIITCGTKKEPLQPDKPIYLDNLNISQIDRKNLENFINTGLKSEVDCFIENYLEKAGAKNLQSTMFRQYVVMDIYIAAANAAETMGFSRQKIAQMYGNEENLLKVFNSINETKAYIKEVLETTIDLREKSMAGKNDLLLKQAQNYIDEHYYQDDISLNTVAAIVSLSPNHFSTVFSHGLGETFIEYLTRVRMDKAKLLLRTTQKKLTDIAFEVGYKDAHYFSSLFKKTQGCTPREYRMKN